VVQEKVLQSVAQVVDLIEKVRLVVGKFRREIRKQPSRFLAVPHPEGASSAAGCIDLS
jgi:hypothetical protein